MAEGGKLSGMTLNTAESGPSHLLPLDSLREAVRGIVAELLPTASSNTPQTLLRQVSLLSRRGGTQFRLAAHAPNSTAQGLVRDSGYVPTTELVTSPPRSPEMSGG
jgi:hypothetical protein